MGYVSYYNLLGQLAISIVLVLTSYGGLLDGGVRDFVHVHLVASLCDVVVSEFGRVRLGIESGRCGSWCASFFLPYPRHEHGETVCSRAVDLDW